MDLFNINNYDSECILNNIFEMFFNMIELKDNILDYLNYKIIINLLNNILLDNNKIL